MKKIRILLFSVMAMSPAFSLATDAPVSTFKFDNWEISVSKNEAVLPFFLGQTHMLKVSGKDYDILYASKSHEPVDVKKAFQVNFLVGANPDKFRVFPVAGTSVFQMETASSTHWVSSKGGYLVATVTSARADARELAKSHIVGVDAK